MRRLLLLLALALLCVTSAQAEDKRIVRISGTGRVKVRPDEAYVEVGLNTVAVTNSVAISANAVVTKQIWATLRENGVEEKSIQTTVYNLSEHYRTLEIQGQGSVQREHVADGYVVHHGIRFTICDMKNLGKVLDAVGGIQSAQDKSALEKELDAKDKLTKVQIYVGSVRFGSSDTAQKEDEARVAAVADAKHKAALLAEELGVELGQVVTFEERDDGSRHRYMADVMYEAAPERGYQAAMGAPTELSAGELTVTKTILVTWRLEDCWDEDVAPPPDAPDPDLGTTTPAKR